MSSMRSSDRSADAEPDHRCPVCLEWEGEEDDSAEWTTQRCGHRLHTACALHLALRGRTNCAICRSHLIEDLSPEEVDDLRAESEMEALRNTERRVLSRALRCARSAQCHPAVVRAVREYNTAKKRLSTLTKERADLRKAIQATRARFADAIRSDLARRDAKAAHFSIQMPSTIFHRVRTGERRVRFARLSLIRAMQRVDLADGE